MKPLLILALAFFLWQSASGQNSEIIITPVLSSASIDSIKVTSGSIILSAPDSSFTGITVGMHLYGLGTPANVTVASLDHVGAGTDTVTLSAAATRTTALATLQFEKATSTPYTAGDWLGLPFVIYENKQSTPYQLKSVVITDARDTLGVSDIVFFTTWTDTLGADNAASDVTVADAHKVAGYHALATAPTDFGLSRVMFKDNIDIVLPGGNLYGRLICRLAQAFTDDVVSNPYRIRMRFKQ